MNLLRRLPVSFRAVLVILLLLLAPALILFYLGYFYWPVYLSLATVIALVLVVTWRMIWGIGDKHPRLRNNLQGLWVSATTLAIILFVLEAVFRLFVARSDAIAITLSHKNWMNRYWKPINSLGYRDDEQSPETASEYTRVLIVGDSFASGAGIEDYHQRMGNFLQEELGDSYRVMLAAKPGWGIEAEYEGLTTYPNPPDVIVLTYYINDIDQLAIKHGVKTNDIVPAARSPYFSLIASSYLLNFVYFQGLRLPVINANNTYLSYLQQAYETPEIWDEHSAQLLAFHTWAEEHNARLIVVAFPSLLQPDTTAFITKKVTTTFEPTDAITIDMAPDLIGEDPKDNIISSIDPHPSISLHQRIADKMCAAIASLPDLPPVSCPQSP
jgi:hypothetical protein